MEFPLNTPLDEQSLLYTLFLMKRFLFPGIILLLFSGCTKKDTTVQDFLAKAYAAEKSIHEKVPIYEDFGSRKIESELRTYLLSSHLALAGNTVQGFIENEEELNKYIESGTLVSIDPGTEKRKYFFYGVPAKYRYLSKSAAEGLHELAERFQTNIHGWTQEETPVVKFAISSAVRPNRYQQALQNRNANAAFMSSHSSGISFDIFYDSFFVEIPTPVVKDETQAETLNQLRVRTGYWLGGYLRRQLRTALVKTLLDLQREGKIYAIYEANQRTYHVTILPN